MTNVYKMKLFRWPGLENSDDYVSYCIKNNKLGWGWPDKTRRDITKFVSTLGDYYPENLDSQHFDNNSGLKTALGRAKNLKSGDFVWTYGTQDGGKNRRWYLGKVTNDQFQCGKCEVNYPGINYLKIGMLKGCGWKPIDNDDVPGEVASFCRADGTIRQLHSKFELYCEWLYNGKPELQKQLHSSADFWKMLHPEDLEDIVGIYLQTQGYYIFPSTNKQGTKDYEFKLIHKETLKEAIIQCKNNADIPLEHLENKYPKEEIYILGIKENDQYKKQYDQESWKNMGWQKGNTFIFNADKLKEWAKENSAILPKRIQNFLKFSS